VTLGLDEDEWDTHASFSISGDEGHLRHCQLVKGALCTDQGDELRGQDKPSVHHARLLAYRRSPNGVSV
jgi:hypothetical protein